ncbi:hypothetical protein ACWCOP_05345 [Maricaulaceae bacterium MS644]
MSECGFGIWFYCVDWASTGAMLGGLGALLGAVAVLLAADNFRKWAEREKFKYNRNISVQILACFYEAEFAISSIRVRNLNASELAEAEKLIAQQIKHLNDDKQQKFINQTVLINRISSYSDTWEKIFQSLPLARAAFGEEAYDALYNVIRVRQKIDAALAVYPETELGNVDVSQVIFRTDDPTSLQAIEINKLLESARSELERLTEPYTSS